MIRLRLFVSILMRFFARHARAINVIGGVLLIGVGVYDLVNNWDLIATYLKIWIA